MIKRTMEDNINSRYMMFVVLTISFMGMLNNSVATPLLANIGQTYPNVSDVMLQQVITLPSLAIIVTILLIPKLNRWFSNKQLICTGLIIFIVSSILLSISMSFPLFLATRLFFGIGVGLINPYPNMLSVMYFTNDNQTKMMGYTNMMRVIGGIVASLLTGYIALYDWHYSFYIYCFAIIPLVLTTLVMDSGTKENNEKNIKVKFSDLNRAVKYLLVLQGTYVLINFVFITNIAIYLQQTNVADPEMSGILMVCFNLISAIMSAKFFGIYKKLNYKIFYIAFAALFISILLIISVPSLAVLIFAAFMFGVPMGIISPLLVRELTNVIDNKAQISSAFTLLSLAVFIGQFMTPIVISLFNGILHVEGAVGSFKSDFVLVIIYFIMTLLYFEYFKKKNSN